MAGRKGRQKKGGKTAKTKTKAARAKKSKNSSWLRRHLSGILLAFALLFFLGGTLLAAGYMVLLSY